MPSIYWWQEDTAPQPLMQQILTAMLESNADRNRLLMRAAAAEFTSVMLDWDSLNIHTEDAINTSPLFNDSVPGSRLTIRAKNWRALIDMLPIPVLAGLMLRVFYPNDVFGAIKRPDTEGVTGTSIGVRTKTGYVLGWPKSYQPSDITEVAHHFREACKARGITPTTSHTSSTTAETETHHMSDNVLLDIIKHIDERIPHVVAERKAASLTGSVAPITDDDLPTIYAQVIESMAANGDIPKEKKTVVTSYIALRREQGKGISAADIEAQAASVEAVYAEGDSGAAESEPTTPKAEASEPVVIDPSLKSGLDMMLTAATKGKIKSIEAIIKQLFESQARLKAAQDETRVALAKAASSSSLPTAMPASGVIPSGKVEWRKASELFRVNGRKLPSLDFNVPFFVWDAPHPHVMPVNPHYQFRASHLLKALTALIKGYNIWAHGHTGTGKTTLLEQITARMNWPLVAVSLDSGIERPDLVGSTQLRSTSEGKAFTEFVDGVLARFLPKPYLILWDEKDYGRGDVLYVIQRALERKGLLLLEDGGRHIVPHEFSRMAATANTRGQGDEYGVYPGARVQSIAMLGRYQCWLKVDYLDKKQETKLLTSSYPNLKAEVAEMMVSFANEVRNAFKNGEVMNVVSPRNLLAMADYYLTFVELPASTAKEAMELALECTVLDAATEDTRQKYVELVGRCFTGLV